MRCERGGRLALAISPNNGRVTVQIILSPAQVASAGAMRLPPAIAQGLDAATDCPEGRWLFIPVTSIGGARELEALIALKLGGADSRPQPDRASAHRYRRMGSTVRRRS